jgi:hypothetical protein
VKKLWFVKEKDGKKISAGKIQAHKLILGGN